MSKKQGSIGESLLLIDSGSLWNMRFIREGRLNYEKLLKNAKERLYQKTLKSLNVISLSEVKSDKFLVTYMNIAEGELKDIISKYGLYELYFWTHRIPPANTFNKPEDLTIFLYREVLNLAIIKYGEIIKNISFESDNSILPSYIIGKNPIDGPLTPQIRRTLIACCELEILSMLFIYATQNYRMYCKGGRLVETSDYKFGCAVDKNEDLPYLTGLYDRRISSANNILSHAGSDIDINYLREKATDERKKSLPALLFHINPDNRYEIPIMNKGKTINKLNSNYIPYPVSLREYYEYMLLFKDEFKLEYGFSVENFISYLLSASALCMLQYTRNINYQYKILQRAYMVIKRKDHLRNLVETIERGYSMQLGKGNLYKEFNKIFDFLAYRESMPRDVDLWTRGPRRIYIPVTNKYFLIDYSGFPGLISTIMLPISRVSGATGNKKSAHFEKKTNLEIVKIFGEKAFWIGREKIHNNKEEDREIDASFCVRDFLFILECKSVNVSFGFDKGDVKSLNYRIEKSKEGLSQVEDKALFIAKNKHSLTKPIPKGIKYIVPILITPFPEYIWEKSENLFLDKDLPKMLTLKELQQIKNMDLNKLIDRPYIVKVNNYK
jgi:hypothetical protein